MKKIKKSIKQKTLEDNIEFLKYLKYDLRIKYCCKPSKVILIDAMIDDTITMFFEEIKKEKYNRR